MVEGTENNQNETLDKVVQEFLAAQLRGEEPDLEQFVRQHPGMEEKIRQKLQNCQHVSSLFDSLREVDETEFQHAKDQTDLTGTRLGAFDITEVIGRGGMGVVYKGHDTRLDRSVSIKSLPPELINNATARTRFMREAKLLASLSHPNIGVIHDIIEQTEGNSYLVLEYIPGQTLAERITEGKFKLQEALTIALQIAEAVAAAHEHDVIHRDLKPGNIKITPEGRVKVLDFGLAKALGSEPSEKPTTITQPGRLMGTPAYMSPEQARGKPTDKRSDIWSFACVLYEMLTGKIPFEGKTAADTLAHIIERQPDWELLPQEIPSNIRTLLRRCLEKDQRRRLQHMGDVVIELEETLSLPAVAPPITTATVEKMRPVGLRKLMMWAVVCLLVGAIAASIVTWNLKRSAPLSQLVRRYTIRPETDFSQDSFFNHILALSPDGKRLAYVEAGTDARRRIYLRELVNEFKAKPLPGTEGAFCPFFSPDGQWVGYTDGHQRKLKKVSLRGGKPEILCDSMQFYGGSWGTDDTIIFTHSLGSKEEGGLWRISASGEGLEQLTVPDLNQGEQGHVWPQILPGGRAVLFTNRCTGGPDIEAYSLETGQRTKLFNGSYARYVPTGHVVYVRRDTLYAVRFDIDRLKVVGSSFPIVPGVMTGGRNSAHFAIAQDGTLAFIPVVTSSTELTPVWVDRNGRVESLPAATPRDYYSATISPDGKQAAFGIRDGSNEDIWIYDLTRDTLTPLTSNGNGEFPIWTPDGKSVVFRSYEDGTFHLFSQNVTGSSEPELLAEFEGLWARPTCCSPDGKEVLVSRWDYYDPNHPRWDNDIYVISLEQNEEYHLRPFIQRNHNQRQGVWSPDGRWVVYAGDESGRWEIYVEPYPGPGPKVMISNQGGYQPAWSRDGKQLFYRSGSGDRKMMAATFETEPEFRVTGFEELFEGQYQRHIQWRNYDVAPDGRFLIIQEPQDPTPPGINVVLNWFEELKKLVPPGEE
jgi:serine/threonine protein kinase